MFRTALPGDAVTNLHRTFSFSAQIARLEIFDSQEKKVGNVAGPYNEDMSINLTCKSFGGTPHPSVTWWRDAHLIDDTFSVEADNSVVNVLTLRLKPQHLMANYVCQASNNNLTSPLSRFVKIDLNRESIRSRSRDSIPDANKL